MTREASARRRSELLSQVEGAEPARGKDLLNPVESAAFPLIRITDRHPNCHGRVGVEAEKPFGRGMKPVAVGDGQPPRTPTESVSQPGYPSRGWPLRNINESKAHPLPG